MLERGGAEPKVIQAGIITIRFDLIKDGMKSRAITSPVFRAGDVAPQFSPSRYLTFEGFSVDENGKQHFMDATVAYRQACLKAIEYLKRFGEPSMDDWIRNTLCSTEYASRGA